MSVYIPALIDLAAVCPTEGVKTRAMDLCFTYVASSSCRRTRADPRAAHITPLSLARLKFHAALRSSSRFPFLSFFFLFFFLFFHTPDTAPAAHPCSFCSFVRFEFALPSFLFVTLPYLSRCAHTRLLILFSVFPLACLYEFPCDLLFRFISIPVRRRAAFRGETSLYYYLFFSLDFDWRCYPSYFTSIKCLLHVANCTSEKAHCPSITQISPSRFNDTGTNLMIKRHFV